MVKRYTVPEYSVLYHKEDGLLVEYKDYAALEARVADLEKDAARYRWLRTYAEVEIPQSWLAHNSLYRDDTADTWDSVIDTAMQGREA